MYLYVGRVKLGGLRGYLWLLGSRLYLKTGWRSSDTHFLGNLNDLLSVAVRIRRLVPRPVDVRKVVAAVVKALLMAKYVAKRCKDSPKWKVRTWELEDAVEQALAYIQHTWPHTMRLIQKRRGWLE
ncbi:MAG: hypothetical protein QXP31_09275 [Pyrobaculum sp.]